MVTAVEAVPWQVQPPSAALEGAPSEFALAPNPMARPVPSRSAIRRNRGVARMVGFFPNLQDVYISRRRGELQPVSPMAPQTLRAAIVFLIFSLGSSGFILGTAHAQVPTSLYTIEG